MLILLAYNTLTNALSKKHPCITWGVVDYWIKEYGSKYKYVVIAQSKMNDVEEKTDNGRVLSRMEIKKGYIASNLIDEVQDL